MKTFNSNWKAKTLTINFNQKQWRQDIAAFIRDCKKWTSTRVTRSKIISEDKSKTIKEFQIFNENNNEFFNVQYRGENQILDSTDMALTDEYIKGRV